MRPAAVAQQHDKAVSCMACGRTERHHAAAKLEADLCQHCQSSSAQLTQS